MSDESELKTIEIVAPKVTEEAIPLEEWYYYCFAKVLDHWEVMPVFGKDPREKQQAIDQAKYYEPCAVKILKFALPI